MDYPPLRWPELPQIVANGQTHLGCSLFNRADWTGCALAGQDAQAAGPGCVNGDKISGATQADAAVGESYAIPLRPPLPLVGLSIRMERGCQHNDRTLANG